MQPDSPIDLNRAAALPLFAGLQRHDLLELLAAGRIVTYKGGNVLFRQGEMGDEAFVVDEGHLEVVAQAEAGEMVLAILQPGSVVGEVALLSPGPRTATVRAIGPGRLWGLNRKAWDTLVAARAPAAMLMAQRMAEMLASRLRATSALVQDTVLSADDGFESGAYLPQPVGELSQSTGLPIRVASELRFDDLADLLAGRILALRIPQYVNRRLADQLCRRLLRHPGFARYLVAPDFGPQRIGMTLFEAENKPELLERYYREALTTSASVRKVCAPMLAPIDRLRLEIEEIWPTGLQIAQFHGKKMLAGIARMFEDNQPLEPHQDVVGRDLPDVAAAQTITAQFTANVYLRLSKAGGEIELWQLQPSQAEAQQLYTGVVDLFDRTKLPPPTAVIRPTHGELTLWLSDRVHAVRASMGGPRVSASCFVGYRNAELPLLMWS